MQINIITVGTKLFDWINQGVEEYTKRIPAELNLNIKEITAEKRTKNSDIPRLLDKEGEKILKAIPRDDLVITLEIDGQIWSTEKLAENLKNWQQESRNISLLIGGPEGLSPACKKRSDLTWSLSRLTLPHPLVRVIIAEQIYRASTILKGHPYHK